MHNDLFLLVLIQSDTTVEHLSTENQKKNTVRAVIQKYIKHQSIFQNFQLLVGLENLICIWVGDRRAGGCLCRKLKWLRMSNLVVLHYWACI